MESNGAPNRIHVSEATATLIKAAGKGTWITMREDRVMAKGKGEMQTYWCEPKAAGSVVSSHTMSTSAHESARSFSPPTTPTRETTAKSIDMIQQMLDANDPTLGSSSSVSAASPAPCPSPSAQEMNPRSLPRSVDGDVESLPSTTDTSGES